MKKILSVFITAVMLVMSFTAVHCEDDIKVTLDGQEIEFDVPPQIINGRTLVPMRAIFEALGAEVEWSQELQTIHAVMTIGNKYRTVTMIIGDNRMFTYSGDSTAEIAVPGDAMIDLDVPPVIIDERTLVPVRAVAESFDCDVDWDADNRTVIISSALPEPTAAPTAVPTDAPVEYVIEYDDTNERQAHYIRNFTITNISKNSDGNYDITCTLETFLEGRGTVGVTFNCLDENGTVVDTFSKMFVGTDYTWSPHTSSFTISGKTAKIELVLNH